jgi:hypothetical protein
MSKPKTNGSIKVYHRFCENMLFRLSCLVFGNEINLRHLIF